MGTSRHHLAPILGLRLLPCYTSCRPCRRVQYESTFRNLLEVLIRVPFPQFGSGRCGLEVLMPDPGELREIQVR